MHILLVRHAEAVPAADGDDASRALTTAGRATAEKVSAVLRDTGVMPRSIVASPRLRTQQTAEIFARTLAFVGAVEVLPGLCFTQPSVRTAIALARRPECVLAVGHMPTLAEMSNFLCGGRGLASFALSEVQCIEDGRSTWTLDPHRLAVVRGGAR